MNTTCKVLAIAALLFAAACADDGAPAPQRDPSGAIGKGDDPETESVEPGWIGTSGSDAPASVQIERYSAGVCRSGTDYRGEVEYGTWARQRSAFRYLCFEVWAPGVTDWDNPDLWEQLDVRAYWRFQGEDDFRQEWVDIAGQVNDNTEYGFGIGLQRDPFVIYGTECPTVPFQVTGDPYQGWTPAVATLQVYFWVNGLEHRPGEGETFTIRYDGAVPQHCVP